MEYEHKGTKIILRSDGEFGARIGPRDRFFPSLAAAKKAIDAHITEAFEPFDVICEPSHNRKVKAGESPWFEIRKVTGIEKAKGKKGWSNRDKYIFADHSERDSHTVLPDTPENRAAYVALREYETESAKIKSEREAKHEALRKALKYNALSY